MLRVRNEMVNKKKIAIIGANESINKLILKAKSLGYETHVFAWECGDPGEATADYFYPISIDNKEAIGNKCKEIGIDGVASVTSDFAVNAVNHVARVNGLTGNSEKTDLLARNKYMMRKALKEAGLFTPWFIKVDSNFDYKDIKSYQYPLIVKPVDRWSSKGVTRINSCEEFREAVEYAIRESLNQEAIVESFMEGQEYSCECICYDYHYDILAFTQKLTTGYPHYVETGHIQPADIEELKVEEIKGQIYKALKALDIRYGAAHAEFKILPNGEIGIIEIGARMGGDCIGTDLVGLSTGYDYLKMVLEVACGNPPDLNRVESWKQAEVAYIFNREDYEVYLQLDKEGKVMASSSINTDFGEEILDSSMRHGYYIVVR